MTGMYRYINSKFKVGHYVLQLRKGGEYVLLYYQGIPDPPHGMYLKCEVLSFTGTSPSSGKLIFITNHDSRHTRHPTLTTDHRVSRCCHHGLRPTHVAQCEHMFARTREIYMIPLYYYINKVFMQKNDHFRLTDDAKTTCE
jgi:hypothetical protein